MRRIELGWMIFSVCEDGYSRLSRWFVRVPALGVGQSTVEYALVGALVVIAAAGALTLLGGEITTVFTRIRDTLSTAAVSTGH